MQNGFVIVDGHIHTFSSDELAAKIIESFNRLYNIDFENPGNGTIKDILAKMAVSGIDYSIMANFAPAKILHLNNLWALETANRHNSLIPLVSFHPEMEGCLAAYLEEYIEKGARGIKIHPMAQGFAPDCKELYDIYALCNERAFPIVFHCGRVSNARLNEYADLEMIMPCLEKYRNIPFVLTHMADGNIEDVVRLADNFENVYFDTSIVITGYPPIRNINEPSWLDDNTVIDVVKRVGAKRLLFGSDYPWGSPQHDLKRFLDMNMEASPKRLILGENAVKLFKIVKN